MATRRREITPGKEKRGTLPLHTGTSQQPRGRSPTAKSTSPASEKHIPNYLKPTISSSLVDKPKHTRRVSFEKTPSPSRTRRTRVSPGPSHRSSSFSGKTVYPQKSIAEKNLRIKDAGKQHSLHARSVASSTIKKSVRKQENEDSTSATKEEIIIIAPHEEIENPETCIVPQPEIQPNYLKSSIAEAEEQTKQDGSENENESKNKKGSEGLVPENHQEQINNKQIEAEIYNEDAKIVNNESSTVVADQDASLGIKTQEMEEKLQIEETSSKQQEIEEHTTNKKQKELEEHTINEIIGSSTDEIVAEKPNEEVEEKKGGEDDSGIEAHQSKETDIVEEKKQEANGIEAHESKETEVVEEKTPEANGIEAHESKETEVVEEKTPEANGIAAHESKETEVVEEKKQEGNVIEAHELKEKEVTEEKKHEAENEAIKQKGPQGKKDSAVSNDTIEETANKLREQRKNKVKALAGAFESVMQ
ncbi:hypothetical protein BUALT_Bualt05G0028400 [Buddleja alternifolia]|uniref:Calmodulin-binding domain-containing protein n=1 Tax=Buddleja alternifolia TaxID=168488 RepID=A0AAV6XSI3_9LAMI|nr:hypothetical protein BUALT_Bualt05G0028400 [Buddleja alternifolia]